MCFPNSAKPFNNKTSAHIRTPDVFVILFASLHVLSLSLWAPQGSAKLG